MLLKLLIKELKENILTFLILCLIPIIISIIITGGYKITGSVRWSLLIPYIVSFIIIGVILFITFYKSINNNLFDDGGYLTLTMPIKTSQILLSKIFNIIILYLLFILSLIISLRIIFFIGRVDYFLYELFSEIFFVFDIQFSDIVLGLLQSIIFFIYSIIISIFILTFLSIKKINFKLISFILISWLYSYIASKTIYAIDSSILVTIIQCMIGSLCFYFSHQLIEKKLDI